MVCPFRRSYLKLCLQASFIIDFFRLHTEPVDKTNTGKDRGSFMKHYLLPLFVAATVAACNGSTGKDNPFQEDPTTSSNNGSGTTTTPRAGLPPGTANPTPDDTIQRFEPVNTDGSGAAQDFRYDAATDTFSVDNLPFDGDNVYNRDVLAGSTLAGMLGPFRVYENENFVTDPQTGAVVTQFQHKAIHAISASGATEFAIVRTGAYSNFGFGGFMYTRNGHVTLPASGFASYTGDYAGIRDFDGQGGVEFVTGTAALSIDFNDFNDGYAVDGQIFNRRVFDADGNDITATVLAALTAEYGVGFAALPTLVFDISNALDENGEMLGALDSEYFNSSGNLTVLEAGEYYGVVAGDDASEIVGIIVVTSSDPRFDGVTVRETGGFLVTR